MITRNNFSKIKNNLWEIPRNYRLDMQVPARFYASAKLLEQILKDKSLEQLVNTSTLPGVVKYTIAMPDIHEGYGAPIGGVFATNLKEGVISPGAVGYDINCGVKLLRSQLKINEVKDRITGLATSIFDSVPSGVGKGGKFKSSRQEMDEILTLGLDFLKKKGYAKDSDLVHCESGGKLVGVDPKNISETAKSRAMDQLGTLGAGNHFIEIQYVSEIYDNDIALKLGLDKDVVTVMIHTGSRGLGHQVATDYIKSFDRLLDKYNIILPDRELACVPFNSLEGQAYFSAMKGSANFAWANRQMITSLIQKIFQEYFSQKGELVSVYDVAHNMAKVEKHKLPDETEVLVHRKGATRAFPRHHEELPDDFKEIGQPVLIPGSMGTNSYVLIGEDSVMEETFGSSCHGAGRAMSRHEALRKVHGDQLRQELEAQGIVIRSGSLKGLAEESPIAYKDVNEVVQIIEEAQIAKKVIKLKPLAVIKG